MLLPALVLPLFVAWEQGWGQWAPGAGGEPTSPSNPLPHADRVEILRTEYGVPHIRAEDVGALGYGLAWVQMEDYGETVLRGLVSGRGTAARTLGREFVEGDFSSRLAYRKALESYHTLSPDIRAILEGFAEGVNAYVRNHGERLPDWAPSDFTGHDLAVRDIGSWSRARARSILRSMGLESDLVPGIPADEEEGLNPLDGSNGWAFAPSRTRSGRPILVRNPHLGWDAGYYEVHVTVPNDIDFYGDFRIGGVFAVIGGFNRHLGWSTTNNAPLLDQAYRVELDQARPDHILFDGTSLPLSREEVTVEILEEDGSLSSETRSFWRTPLGPVIHRDAGAAIVLRDANEGAVSRGTQYLAMLRSRTRQEWEAAMRLNEISSSNFMYADTWGNIQVVFNARLPRFPHAPAPDSALTVRTSNDIWNGLLPWDSLPRHLNPLGGYVHNANDTPHFDNLRRPIPHEVMPRGIPEPRLRLRSQLSVRLAEGMGNDLTLDRVLEVKNDLTMLAAERLKPDLVRLARDAAAAGTRVEGANAGSLRRAADLLERWDNTASVEARGALLFDEWQRIYFAAVSDPDSLAWAEPWQVDHPMTTPTGVGSPELALSALGEAMSTLEATWGGWDLPWGQVHRARMGEVDLPAAGCSNRAGCFRILEFQEDEADGKRRVFRGDAWVLGVEFTDPIQARTILAYGQSENPDSPHHTDQLELFLDGGYKRVVFEPAAVDAAAVRRYRPGR
jgi:acyl-homoserine-lactone acylase